MSKLFHIIKATKLADATSNAYKFRGFGRDEWLKCIIFLYSEGVDTDQIEYIVRSKHMRWSEDFQFGSSSDCFIDYWRRNTNGVRDISVKLHE